MNQPAGNGREHFDAKAFCDRMSDLLLLRKFKWMLAKVPRKNPAYDPLAEAEALERELLWVTQIVERFSFHERIYPSKVGPERRKEVAAAAGVSLPYLDDLLRQMQQVDAMLAIMARPIKKVYGAPKAPRKPKSSGKGAPPTAGAKPELPKPPAARQVQAAAAASQPEQARAVVAPAWPTAEDRMRWFPVWNRNLVLWEFIADPSE